MTEGGSDEVVEMRTTPSGTVTLRANGLLELWSHSRVVHDAAVARSGLQACLDLAAGRHVPVLADAREIGAMTRDGREAYTSAAPSFVTAMAILVDSPFSRVVGSMFLRVGRPSVPTRLFTNRTEATDWLSQYPARP